MLTLQNEKRGGLPASESCLIDKTKELERGIGEFPSVFVEGAAATGKTMAVEMLLDRHPEAEAVFFHMCELKKPEVLAEKLKQSRPPEGAVWTVFEDINEELPEETEWILADYIRRLPAGNHAILVSRVRPGKALLDLLWKRKMKLITRESLFFTEEEIAGLCLDLNSPLDPQEVYEITGGWPGCADLMLRLSAAEAGGKRKPAASDYRKRYEIDAYITREILGTLDGNEREILRRAAICPWISEMLLADVWNVSWTQQKLENLERQGFLVRLGQRKAWSAANLFKRTDQEITAVSWNTPVMFWKRLSSWYEKQGYIRECLYCVRQTGNSRDLREVMIRHYEMIPFLELSFDDVMNWNEITPEACWLRGMYSWLKGDFQQLERECQRMERNKDQSLRHREVFLNLAWADPSCSLDEWLGFVEEAVQSGAPPLRLYHWMGGSCTFLSGIRDLSDLFACTRKEEKRKERIWRSGLSEPAGQVYEYARADYYYEIIRDKTVLPDTGKDLREWSEMERYQLKLAELFLKNRLGESTGEEAGKTQTIKKLEEELQLSDSALIRRNVWALKLFCFSKGENNQDIVHWIREGRISEDIRIGEENYIFFFGLCRVYMTMNQYEKADRILKKILPFLREYRRTRFLAEALFEQAIVSWKLESHSQGLRYMIESMLVCGERRYVRFYTIYGRDGQEVLSAWVDWMKKNAPEGWHRKKKYNYGDVRRMPDEDYQELLLRIARKKAGKNMMEKQEKQPEECLTLMETIMLKAIAEGKSNAEISGELNLKLSTVKSHIYSLYKKLGVSTRIQASLKGRELGIIK